MPYTFAANFRPWVGQQTNDASGLGYKMDTNSPYTLNIASANVALDNSTYYAGEPSTFYITDFQWKLHSSSYTSNDDGYATTQVPFFTGQNFYMNGTAYSSYYVGTNGIITFGVGSSSSVVPTSTNGINLNGADLWLQPGLAMRTGNLQNIYYQNISFTLNGVSHLRHTGIIYYGTYGNTTYDRSVTYTLTRAGSVQYICIMIRPESAITGGTIKPATAGNAVITGVTPVRGVGYTWRSVDNGVNWTYCGVGWATFAPFQLDTSVGFASLRTFPLYTILGYAGPYDEGRTDGYGGVTGSGTYTYNSPNYHPSLDYNLKVSDASNQNSIYGVLFRVAAFGQSARNTWEAFVNNSIDPVSGTAWKFLNAGASGVGQTTFALNFLRQSPSSTYIPQSNLAVQKIGRLMAAAKTQADYSTWVSAGYILANNAGGQEWRMGTPLFYDTISTDIHGGFANNLATNSYYYLTSNNYNYTPGGPSAYFNATYPGPSKRKYGFGETAAPTSGQVSISNWNGHMPIGGLHSYGRAQAAKTSYLHSLRYTPLFQANVTGASTTLQFSNTSGGADANNFSYTLDGAASNNGIVSDIFFLNTGAISYSLGSGTSAVTMPPCFLAAGIKTSEFAKYVSVQFVGNVYKTNSNTTVRVLDYSLGDVAQGAITTNWMPLDRTRAISIRSSKIDNTGITTFLNGVCNTTISGTIYLRNNFDGTTISRSFLMRQSGV